MLRLLNGNGSTRFSTSLQQNIICLSLLVVFTGAARGQVLYGPLTGTVSDSSGARGEQCQSRSYLARPGARTQEKQSNLPVTLRLGSEAS